MRPCPSSPAGAAFPPQEPGPAPGKEVNAVSEPKPSCEPLASLFRDIVLVLGGVFAVQGTDDETVRRVARGLDRAWRRARGLPAAPPPSTSQAPHPAIAALLRLTDDEGVIR